MDLGNKEYLQVASRSVICTIFTLCTKECLFTGHQSAVLEIRDIEQQDLTFPSNSRFALTIKARPLSSSSFATTATDIKKKYIYFFPPYLDYHNILTIVLLSRRKVSILHRKRRRY